MQILDHSAPKSVSGSQLRLTVGGPLRGPGHAVRGPVAGLRAYSDTVLTENENILSNITFL